MVKGDDAVRRKKNKSIRKKMRSQNAVSARVATIIATKKRRKAGKRRKCEGMCFTLPTVDDPFNDRSDPKARKLNNTEDSLMKSKRKNDDKYQRIDTAGSKPVAGQGQESSRKKCDFIDDVNDSGPSKFLICCLEIIQKSWTQGDESKPYQFEPSLFSSWGIDFWNKFSGGSDILEMGDDSASKEQVAWVISIASDVITRKEKEGAIVTTPFLLYIVPSKNKATEIRSICKPLKSLGIHTVSLHTGALLDHQVCGLKSCEPEFIVSTPERLLELIQIKAVDVSKVSMLVLDGAKEFLSSGFTDVLISIKKCIRGNYQTIVFSHSSVKEASALFPSL